MKLKQNLPNIMYLYNSKIKKKNGRAFPHEQFNASFLFFFYQKQFSNTIYNSDLRKKMIS